MSAVVQPALGKPLSRRYEALLRASQTLMSNHCSEELFSLFAKELRQVVNFYFLAVAIYDERKHEVCVKTFVLTDAPMPVPELPREETLTWWVFQHQEPLVIPSLEAETRFPAVADVLKSRGIHSVCTLPL